MVFWFFKKHFWWIKFKLANELELFFKALKNCVKAQLSNLISLPNVIVVIRTTAMTTDRHRDKIRFFSLKCFQNKEIWWQFWKSHKTNTFSLWWECTKCFYSYYNVKNWGRNFPKNVIHDASIKNFKSLGYFSEQKKLEINSIYRIDFDSHNSRLISTTFLMKNTVCIM